MNSSPNEFSQSANQPESSQSEAIEEATQLSSSSPTSEPEVSSSAETPEGSDREDREDPEAQSNDADGTAAMRQRPIPPPSEPRQYRAIGLVQGRYEPSEEQLTRGNLITSEGTAIDAVLLGKIMSLVKNHLNTDEDHLWVVYPRTRQEERNLHVQIMGVWEPETLAQPQEESSEAPDSDSEAIASESEPPPSTLEDPTPEIEDGYFSIRGEVVFQSQEQGYIVVKIKQTGKEGPKPKFFKLQLQGFLPGKAVGHFWDLHVRRNENTLEIVQGNDMGLVGPKRKKPFKGKGKGFRKTGSYKGSKRPDTKPNLPTPTPRTEPLPKPVKRTKPTNEP